MALWAGHRLNTALARGQPALKKTTPQHLWATCEPSAVYWLVFKIHTKYRSFMEDYIILEHERKWSRSSSLREAHEAPRILASHVALKNQQKSTFECM